MPEYIGTAAVLQSLWSAAMQARQQGAGAETQRLLQQALSLRPLDADAWFERGVMLQQLGVVGEAISAYREALRGRPEFPEAWNNQAAALRALRRLDEALSCTEQALALRPAYPRALNNRGLVFLDRGRGSLAVADFTQALTLDPRFVEAQHNLGTALMQLRRYQEAQAAFRALPREFPHASGNALFAAMCDCNWTALRSESASVRAAVGQGLPAATPMTFLSISGAAKLQLRCAQTHTHGFYPPAKPAPLTTVGAITRPSDSRIRIAYLSGDFGEHAVSYLLAGVLEHHDTSKFEVFALSWGRRSASPTRQRIEGAVAHFITIDDLSDAAVVDLMRRSAIDIAIDLCGHTEGQRTAIFAQRAAPVQVNFLGLPATMGAHYMDYLIADPFLVPKDQDACYAEKVVRLEGGFQPNDDRRAEPPPSPSRTALGLPEDAVVLCCFNRNHKITPEVFATWMRVLQGAPATVLWLLASHEGVAHNLRREAQACGVDPSRLVFVGESDYAVYLARYRHADLFLDTAPFNGGTTASDALSMGVPLITMAGESFSGRMAGSVLHALGYEELIANSLPQYESLALHLARDPQRLGILRTELARARQSHSFFNTHDYCRRFEGALTHMAARSEAGLAPIAFTVDRDGQALSE